MEADEKRKREAQSTCSESGILNTLYKIYSRCVGVFSIIHGNSRCKAFRFSFFTITLVSLLFPMSSVDAMYHTSAELMIY